MRRLIGVAVAVDHRDAVLERAVRVRGIVLLTDDAARIHAEGAHLVLKRIGIIDHLGLIQVLGQVVHDGIRNFYTHADIHLIVLLRNIVVMGDLVQPVRTAAARGCDHVFGADLLPGPIALCQYGTGQLAVVPDDGIRVRALHKCEARQLFQIVIHGLEHIIGVLRAHVADGAFNQVDIMLTALIGDVVRLFVVQAEDLLRSAEIEIDAVCIVDQLPHLIHGQIVDQIAAHLL